MLSYLMKGGPVLIVIGIVSVAASSFAILQFLRLRAVAQNHSKQLQSLADLLQKRHWFEALELLDQNQHPFFKSWRGGLLLLLDTKNNFEHIEDLITVEGNRLVANLESALKPLGAFTTVLPMLGFLGTILGLITSFHAWELMGAQVSMSVLAGGIYQAMITTAVALALAIPYYLIYHLLVTWTHKLAFHFSAETSQFLRWIREGLSLHHTFSSEEILNEST